MKKILLIIFLCMAPVITYAQEDTLHISTDKRDGIVYSRYYVVNDSQFMIVQYKAEKTTLSMKSLFLSIIKSSTNVRYILEIWKEKMFQKSLLTRFLITSRDLQKKNCSQNYPTKKSLLTWMVATKQCFSMTNLKRMRYFPLRFGMERLVGFQDR